MRHPVRRSLALTAAAAGLVAFGATAAHADSDLTPAEKTNRGVWSSVATATDGGRAALPSSDDCDPAPGEVCRTDPEEPTGFFVTQQASPRSGDEGELIPRIPAEEGSGPVLCDQYGNCEAGSLDPTVPSIPGIPARHS
ncbi:hypothetical protein [Streptomyces sp. NPDC014733]|uniref:hypothetical protein n=1 Tax=Streptomyces sp. NPDC014733 TaxID=3364885 RepID=UPI0036FBF136